MLRELKEANAKAKMEYMTYLQRLHKEGLARDEIPKRTAAELSGLLQGECGTGCKMAKGEIEVGSFERCGLPAHGEVC